MADTALSALTATTTLASGDLMYVVDGGASRSVDWSVVISQLSGATKTLTNTTLDANGTGNSISNIETADLAAAAKTGSDTAVVTGTAGTNGNLLSWNIDGDAVDSGVAAGDVITSLPSASATVSGVVELATIAEVDTGTDTVRAITPAGLAGSALQTKVDGIEAGADVTDTANVTAAGALMDSEVDADLKTLVLPANTTITAFAQTLLDDTTQGVMQTTLGVDPAGTDNSTDVTLSGTGTYLSIVGQTITVDPITESDISDLGNYQVILTEGAFVDGDKTKLNGIEAGADVTDTANVTAAGALMDSEVTNLAQVKAFDSSDYATAAQGALADSAQQPPVEGAFVDGDKTKLDGIETGADVTDAANVETAIEAITFASVTGATGDEVMVVDATDGGLKAVLWENLPGAGGGISNVVEDTTPQLGGQLDINGQAIGDGTRELLTFTEDASAVNHVNIENEATGSGPIIAAAGDDTNVDLNLAAKGTGNISLGNFVFDADQTVGSGQDNYALMYDNAGGAISLEAVVSPGDTLASAFTADVDDDGTQSSGTYTPSLSAGSNYKKIVNGGAFTLAPPSLASNTATTLSLFITNNASAGAITTSGFTQVVGDDFTTTDGDDFLCRIEVFDIGGTEYSFLNVAALQ